MHFSLIAAVFSSILLGQPASAETLDDSLRIATWNIQNFQAIPGFATFDERGTMRDSGEISEVVKNVKNINATVFSFQEITDVRSLFYLTRATGLSPIYSPQMYARERSYPDIFPAFGINNSPNLQVLDVLYSPPPLAGDEADKGFTRGLLGLDFRFRGRHFLVFNLHLKSGCRETRNLDVSRDCKLKKEALSVVAKLLKERGAGQLTVILTGDFNRAFFATERDALLDFFKDQVNHLYPEVRVYPQHPVSTCSLPARNDKDRIDFFIILGEYANSPANISFHELDLSDKSGSTFDKISDHCPSYIELHNMSSIYE